MKPKLSEPVLIAVPGVVPLLYWSIGHLQQDAWWDEIVSLKEYALVDIRATLTTYPDPNNHIFFNLLENILARVAGIRDSYVAMDLIYLFRSFQFIIALGTLMYVFLLVRNFFSKRYSGLAVVLLTTCIPFLNFSLQLRGYNISILFAVMIIYHTWSYLNTVKRVHLIVLSLSVFLLLYTIPSNVYFLIAFCITVLVRWRTREKEISRHNKVKRWKSKRTAVRKCYIHWGISLGAGLVMCYLAYLPVMDTLLDNRFVSKNPPDRYFVLIQRLPEVIKHFLSGRWLLLIPVCIVLWQKIGKGSRTTGGTRELLFVLLMPFLLLFFHNKMPFERTFITLIPVFTFILTLFLIRFLEMNFRQGTRKILLYTTVLYLVGNCIYQLRENDRILAAEIENGVKEQNIYRNYYLASNFKPGKVAKDITAHIPGTNSVALLVDEVDRVSLIHYLEKEGYESLVLVNIKVKKSEINGQVFNYEAIVQRSKGREEEELYLNVPCNINPGEDISFYKLLLEINRHFNKNKNTYLIAGFSAKREKAIQQLQQVHSFTPVGSYGFVKTFRLGKVVSSK